MKTLPVGRAGLISAFSKPRIAVAGRAASDEQIERMRWVIGIRWTVVVALLLVGVLGATGQGSATATGYWHLALAVLVAAVNLAYKVTIDQPGAVQTRLFQTLRYAQIPVDLLIFTVIIHFSGGATGPVFVLYFLYIFVGLAILPPSGAYLVAGTSAVLYALLALFEAFGTRPPSNVIDAHLIAQPPPPGSYLGYVLTVSATLMIIAYIANFYASLLTRNEGTIREQLSEMNALYSFTRATATTHISEDIRRALVASSMEVERASSCSLLLFNEAGDAVFAETAGFTAEQAAAYSKMQLSQDQPVLRMLLADGKGVFAPEVEELRGLRSILVRPNTRSFYAVPMWQGNQMIGTLNLSFDHKYTMPISHWKMLGAMIQQAAVALERTRLFSEAQRAARESASLYHIGLVTTSTLQIDEVMQLIYEQVNRVVHPDTFYIALYDEEQSELRYDIFVESGVSLPPFRARLDSVGKSSWVIRNRKPIFIRHWSMEEELLPFEGNIVGATSQSSISVPLIAKDKIVGVLSVQSLAPDSFDSNHLRLLTSIANQAALALENARLHATVNEQAQHDSLTGAYNHGTFIEKLNRALATAQEEHSTVALVMLDIDKFKNYNDSYGHLIGNDVLRSVVSAIQGHIKSTDVVGRWGGEEFAILLPSVGRAQARLVTERIRQTVANNVIRDMQNRPIPSPTVSQGIALFPDDAVGLDELIGKADTALYEAKDMGRNHIVEWISLNGHATAVPAP